MMGRLLSPDQSERSRRPDDARPFQPLSDQPFMNTVISHQQIAPTATPNISPTNQRPDFLSPRSTSSFSEMPPLQERSRLSFQKSLSTQSDITQSRTSAVSPTLKLPPILATKSSSSPEVMQSCASSSGFKHLSAANGNVKAPTLMDMRIAYESMMVNYFMQESTKTEGSSLPGNMSMEQSQDLPELDAGFVPSSLPPISQAFFTFNRAFDAGDEDLPDCSYRTNQEEMLSLEKSLNAKNASQESCVNAQNTCFLPAISQHTSRDVTSSGCTVLNKVNFAEYQHQPMEQDKPPSLGMTLNTDSTTNDPRTADVAQLLSNPLEVTATAGDPSVSDMATLLNDISMFLPSQNNNVVDPPFSSPSSMRAYNSTTSNSNERTSAGVGNSSANHQYQTKPDPAWGHFSVLPPVMSGTSTGGGCISDTDTISLMSYNSVQGNAQNCSQAGMYSSSFSPLSLNFPDNVSAAFTPESRYSGRSSHSRKKRALSNSPLSAEGIDLNAIIRMSPTSLVAYINGSRSSSSCVSQGSIGEKAGCYGHLSARNSSSSPNSGSNSSGNRRSTSYTPQTSTPGSNSRSNNAASDSSNLSAVCTNLGMIDENLLVMQAMQELEAGVGMPDHTGYALGGIMQTNQFIPECENLQVLPQDIAALRTEDLLPFVPNLLPPVHTHLPQPPLDQPTGLPQPPLDHPQQHSKPPPTYDQHMARKAALKKNSSSESSSQPSNSSSFESSEGDKVTASSGTDTETNRTFVCRWLDCTAVYQDQDDFVNHIEKMHVDQRKGEDFVCYWKPCPRRLHPFNARYKLLVHMRVHSGDKPNKCTYAGCKKAFSRLENLKIHLRSHTGERPYSCTFPGCTRTFSNSSDRTKHQKTHQETKPYVCQVASCEKRYTDPSSLRKHVKKSHPDKKEPDRKKIRGGVEEMDPKDLSECLIIQAIKPITLCDSSPPEPTDSGLGRSPRGSQLASSVDHYSGLTLPGDSFTRSETGQGSSSHTSPSSHNSNSPRQIDREKLPPNNNSLRVPILPSIASSPSTLSSLSPRQQIAPRLQLKSVSPRTSASVQGTRNPSSRASNIYSSPFSSPIYKSPINPPSKIFNTHTRGNS